MILGNMQPEKMLRGEIPSTLRTPIGMRLRIVNFEFFERRKLECLSMGWEGAFHHSDSSSGGGGGGQRLRRNVKVFRCVGTRIGGMSLGQSRRILIDGFRYGG